MSEFTESAESKQIDQREHNNDAAAKRTVLRYQDASGSWLNWTPDMVAGEDFDYLDVQQTDSDTETFVFKTGGSGGTTVRTIVVNYTSSAKTDIDNVSWS